MEEWQNPETLALWFGITLLFVTILVVSIIFLVRLNYRKIIERTAKESQLRLDHQRQLLETSITIQEKERDRIAADLHDGLIGKLTVLRLQQQILKDPAQLDEMLSESITVARRISHDLSPPLIEITPIDEIVKDLVEPWKLKFNLMTKIEMRADFTLSPRNKIQLTRIMQELFTNIDKHSKATLISVYLRQTERLICLQIKDNGEGLDTAILKKGLGLNSIESRVQYMQGFYKIKSRKQKYTSFLFVLKKDNT